MEKNQILFYKVLINSREGRKESTDYIKNKTKVLLTREEDIMQRWREYFEEALDNQSDGNRIEEIIPEIENEEDEDKLITMEELEKVKNKMKTGKVMLLELINKIRKKNNVPAYWE